MITSDSLITHSTSTTLQCPHFPVRWLQTVCNKYYLLPDKGRSVQVLECHVSTKRLFFRSDRVYRKSDWKDQQNRASEMKLFTGPSPQMPDGKQICTSDSRSVPRAQRVQKMCQFLTRKATLSHTDITGCRLCKSTHQFTPHTLRTRNLL